MNKSAIIALKATRKLFNKLSFQNHLLPESIQQADKASQIIFDSLISNKPSMIARFGSTELTCLANYIGVKFQKNQIFSYVTGKAFPWWWDFKIINQMHKWSGFFPSDITYIEEYCELFLNDIPEVDILGSWLSAEKIFESYMNCTKVQLRLLEPFWSNISWTQALKNKKVLVIHPFAETIQSQYSKRNNLFEKNILPNFTLITLKAVQTIAGNKSEYNTWFEALEFMKSEIDKIDYDICLIGCGAYGFHLAAHVKRSGKKAFHLGGALQLLFGIIGKRWEDPTYGVSEWGIPIGTYSSLINNFWVRPNENELPRNAQLVEGACYW